MALEKSHFGLRVGQFGGRRRRRKRRREEEEGRRKKRREEMNPGFEHIPCLDICVKLVRICMNTCLEVKNTSFCVESLF